MADYFLGEIRPFALNFAPAGWALCQGQTFSIQQYAALFSLLGTTYGGNGTTNFQLPNLPGQVLVGTGQLTGGQYYNWGETGGVPSVALNSTEIPQHNHVFNAASAGAPTTWATNEVRVPTTTTYLSNLAAKNSAGANLFGFGFVPSPANVPNTQLAPTSISVTGGSQPHENRPPFLTINYCIALTGVFPARN